MLVYFSGDWDVHWGYGLLTYGQVRSKTNLRALSFPQEELPSLALSRASAQSEGDPRFVEAMGGDKLLQEATPSCLRLRSLLQFADSFRLGRYPILSALLKGNQIPGKDCS